ncbi:MAG: CcoQ/FixQ family Cbb3-type cytochrome c oxidase assembly chaperone [Ferruginibacter sp.]
MFKFIKQYAEKMTDANIYPMISLLIFFIFFVVLLVLVKKMKKERVTELSNLPFEHNEQLTNTTTL